MVIIGLDLETILSEWRLSSGSSDRAVEGCDGLGLAGCSVSSSCYCSLQGLGARALVFGVSRSWRVQGLRLSVSCFRPSRCWSSRVCGCVESLSFQGPLFQGSRASVQDFPVCARRAPRLEGKGDGLRVQGLSS